MPLAFPTLLHEEYNVRAHPDSLSPFYPDDFAIDPALAGDAFEPYVRVIFVPNALSSIQSLPLLTLVLWARPAV